MIRSMTCSNCNKEHNNKKYCSKSCALVGMNELNKDPKHKEKMRALSSKAMTEFNHRMWKDPEYRKVMAQHNKDMIADPNIDFGKGNHVPRTEDANILMLESKGLDYYKDLASEHPCHYTSFYNMHQRIVISKLETDFPRTRQGFIDFITYLGPVPEGMIKPTVGRKDHGIGYVRGNFSWQEHLENATDGRTRSWDKRNLLRNQQKSTPE